MRMRKMGSAILLLCGLGAGPRPAWAQGDARTCSERYFLFARETLTLGDRTSIASGDLAALDRAEVGADAAVHGNLLAANRLTLRERAILNGALYTSGTPERQNGTVITGPTAPASALAPCSQPDLPLALPGGSNPAAPAGAGLDLAPGRYGEVTLPARSTLLLASGTYHFDKLAFEPDTRIVVSWSGGPAILNVKTRLAFGDRHVQAALGQYQGGRPPLEFRVASGEGLRIGTDSRFLGRILAPAAEVVIGSRTGFEGPVYARSIRVEPDVKVGDAIRLTVCQ